MQAEIPAGPNKFVFGDGKAGVFVQAKNQFLWVFVVDRNSEFCLYKILGHIEYDTILERGQRFSSSAIRHSLADSPVTTLKGGVGLLS